MASLNKVTLIGNLGKDPEVRYMPNGDAVANITVATTETWKDKNGEKQEKTEWHRVTFYRKLAEIVGEYLKKGRPVYVEGRLETRKWTDKQGIDRYTTEIIANDMKMLGSAPGGLRDDGDDNGFSEAPRTQSKQGQEARQGGGGDPYPSKKPSSSFDDMDDDIPF